MLTSHTEWLVKVLDSLDDVTKEYAIKSIFLLIDQDQYKRKPEYQAADPNDLFENLLIEQRIAVLPGNEVYAMKLPTLDNVLQAITRLTNNGIFEPFLITSLYDAVTALFEYQAAPESMVQTDQRLRSMLEFSRKNPGRLGGIDDPERHAAFIASMEELLSDLAVKYGEKKRMLEAWKEATNDRWGQERNWGAWTDLLELDGQKYGRNQE